MEVTGWKIAPRYDQSSKVVEWATIVENDGEQFVNHNVRILGRYGVMEVTLAASTEKLNSILPELHELLEGFDFNRGNRYSEVAADDLVADFGLGGLVAGYVSIDVPGTESTNWFWDNIWRNLLIGIGLIGVIFSRFFKRKNQEFDDEEEAKRERERVSSDIK